MGFIIYKLRFMLIVEVKIKKKSENILRFIQITQNNFL